MSDENQPNEVVASQPELDDMVMDAVPEPVPMAVELESAAPVDDVGAAPQPVEDAVPEEPVLAVEAELEAETLAADSPAEPSIVSIADVDSPQPSFVEKLDAALGWVTSLFQGRVWLLGVLVGILVVGFLFLPPISLAQRITGGGGYEVLHSETPALEHPDGLKVSVNGDMESKLRIKLDSVPRAEFIGGNVPAELEPALANLPTHLVPKGPYYTLDIRGKERGPAVLDVVIPLESEPWETLDLYTWDAEAETWQWVPTQLDRDAGLLHTELNALPSSLVVMQTNRVQQSVAAEVAALPLNGADVVLTEANISGMLIGTWGGLTGDSTELPAADPNNNVDLVPMVRNWVPGREPNWALVNDMLTREEDRQAHIDNLVNLAKSGSYPGVILDYRALPVADRDRYAAFVTDLGKAFHEHGLRLAVVVEMPQQAIDGTWDTGAYDWYTLGLAVDQLRVVMPLDPRAYAPGGFVEQMLSWAVSRVNRYRLMPVFSTMSTDGLETLTVEEVFSAVGEVAAKQTLTTSVEPGTPLSFVLDKAVTLEVDPVTGATQVVNGNATHWLGTPQWLRARLDLAARYHLGGVVLQDLLAEGNMGNLMPAIADYQAQIEPAAYVPPEVTWQVTGPNGAATQATTSLAQSEYAWTAPALTGTYSIGARVAGLNKGMVKVEVAVPAPVVTDTLAAEGEESEGESLGGSTTSSAVTTEPEETEETEVWKATFVSDVTIPDNTRMEKGEAFVKTWRLKNAGDTTWPKSTVLGYVSGEQMTEVNQVAVGEIAAGDAVDISVDLTAPENDGTFKGIWRLYADDVQIEGGAVMVIIKVGEEPQPTVNPEPGPVQPVASGGFELGGHVRDMGLPYSDKMHYAGMKWAKVQVHYAEDATWMINAAHAAGFYLQISALGGPGMVIESGFEQKYAGWVAGMAAAGADAIEIWNEPNIEREWQIGHISPQAYTNLLCASYSAIKAANSGTIVISAAPAPTGWFGGCGPNGCDDQPWMEGLYNAGAASCMDYIGAHHNAGATSPSARIGHPANPSDTHHSWFFLPQTELYYNIFRGTRQLFYTEMGYASQEGLPTFSDQFAWARGINNAQQAAWLAEAVQLSINTGMVRCIIVWNIDFVRYGYDPQDGYAIIRPGGSCPACDALHNVLGTQTR